MVAIDETGTARGFIHFGFGRNHDGLSLSDCIGIIHRLCIEPQTDEDEIAKQLIQYAKSNLVQRGARRIDAFGTPTHSTFYLGVAEGDNMMGVLSGDTRCIRWLNASHFIPTQPIECWDLDLGTFRPPMDRLQIAIRRTCTIGRILDEYHPQWWMSAILGHCEQMRFNLVLRNPPIVDCEIMLWYPDSTLFGLDSSVVRMWLGALPGQDESRERFVYLMSESLRQLQQERKRIVRTYASAQEQQVTTLLQRLGFRSAEHGLAFQCSI